MTLIIMEMGKKFEKRFFLYICLYLFLFRFKVHIITDANFGFHVIVEEKGMEFHLPAIDATTKVISTENVSLKEA